MIKDKGRRSEGAICLDIPHRGADLDHYLHVLGASHGKKWLDVNLPGGTSGAGRWKRGWAGIPSVLSILAGLQEFLAATWALTSRSIIMRTSTVGCQMGIVDSRI